MKKLFIFILLSSTLLFGDTIKGIVVDLKDNPVKNAEIKVEAIAPLTEKDTKTAKTDKKGEFIIENLKTGYYYLRCNASEFLTCNMGRIEVNQAKYGIKSYKIVMQKPGSISGYVYDENSKPIERAKVGNYSVSVFTDKNGFYRITNLYPGKIYLYCEKEEYIRAEKQNIIVEENKETGGINFTLQIGGSISGEILDDENKSIKNSSVYTEGNMYKWTRTDEKGHFIIKGLLPGIYKISVYAQGYEYGYAGNIEVKKGETTKIAPVHLKLRPKNFYLFTRTSTFLPTENVTLFYNSFRITKVKVDVYKVDIFSEINKIRWREAPNLYNLQNNIKTDGYEPLFSKEFKIEYPSPLSDLYHKTIEISKLPAGVYIIVAKPEDFSEQRKLIIVTDIGIICKSAEKQSYLYLVDLITGKKLPEVKVYFSYYDSKLGEYKFKTKTTDENGIIEFENFSGTLFASKENSFAYIDYGYERSFPKEKIYVYTDRPVYRPEQTVYFKGILRKDEGDHYLLKNINSVIVNITDPMGNNVYSTNAEVKNGSFSGSFTIPDEAPLSLYYLNVYNPEYDYQGSVSFKVLEYRKPEFFVEVKSDKERYLPNEKVKILINSKYYFGAPVKNADVSYAVYETPLLEYDDYYEGKYEGEYYGYRKYLTSGETKTDEKGEVLIEFMTKSSYENETIYTVEVRVTDISKREVKSDCSFKVVPGNFRINITTTKYLYTHSENIPVKIEVMNYDGIPVKNQKINLKVDLEKYKNKKFYYKTILADTIKTDEKGKIEINIKPDVCGYIRISASSIDEFNNLITSNKFIWIASENYYFNYGKKELEIITDKKNYRTGENAKILINSSIPDLTLFLTIESYRIHETKIFEMKGNSVLIEIPIKKEYLPNVYLSVFSVRNKKFYEITKNIKIAPDEKFLKVDIITDKDNYTPGEKAIYRIKTTDFKGNPVSAELSFQVVDEAIYAISPELQSKIEDFFYGNKPNFVSTTYSFIKHSYGGTSKDIKDIDIRRKFKDTAYWNPYIFTDRNGNATVEVELPDNLTTWRAKAVAVTHDTLVGTGINKIKTSKPLIARLILPRFLVEDDILFVSGIIHNYTKKAQDLKVVLKGDGFEMLDKNEVIISVEPDSEKRVQWQIKVKDIDKAKFTLIAWNSEVNDGMELEIPVYLYGNEIREVKSGKCDKEITEKFDIPVNSYKVNLISIIYPSIASGMYHALEYLVNYPYGCTEQTMNTFLPAIYVNLALKNLGVEDLSFLADNIFYFQNMLQKLPKIMNKGLSKLYRYQHDDGGWGWWESDPSHPYLSSYVMYGLSQIKKVGYIVNENVYSKGKNYLKNILPDIKENDTLIYVLYSLFESCSENMTDGEDKIIREYSEKLYNNLISQKTIHPYTGAQLSLILNKFDKNKAKAILDKIYKDIKLLTPYSAFFICEKENSYRWIDNNIEGTAWVLKATLQIEPEREEIYKIIRYLVETRRLGYWRSTKETAVCINALTDFLLKNPSELHPDYSFLLYLNNE
ncbi:MAG TPA: carboxypeptidase regulatory-like domain-containing protein, partial [bacterium]|nr:carboxypeptidase regulatory-like domain-containing protein [bacterium]